MLQYYVHDGRFGHAFFTLIRVQRVEGFFLVHARHLNTCSPDDRNRDRLIPDIILNGGR